MREPGVAPEHSVESLLVAVAVVEEVEPKHFAGTQFAVAVVVAEEVAQNYFAGTRFAVAAVVEEVVPKNFAGPQSVAAGGASKGSAIEHWAAA